MRDTTLIPHDVIARLIPHAGDMCLLESVLAWDVSSIRCVSTRHCDPNHPLHQAGRLGALCGVELAVQAMAVHGGLSGVIGERPRAGYLVSLREVECRCDRLDRYVDDLIIDATRLMGDDERVMYSFAIICNGQDLVTGRATVLLKAESPP